MHSVKDFGKRPQRGTWAVHQISTTPLTPALRASAAPLTQGGSNIRSHYRIRFPLIPAVCRHALVTEFFRLDAFAAIDGLVFVGAIECGVDDPAFL